MRMRVLRRARDLAGVRLLFPAGYQEYLGAFESVGRLVRPFGPAGGGGPPAGRGAKPPDPPVYVATTAGQRALWDLPDFGGSAPVVAEARALDMLLDRAADPRAAYRPFPSARPGSGVPGGNGASRPGFEAARALSDLEVSDAAVDDVLGKLKRASLPPGVERPLSKSVRGVLGSQWAAVSALAQRVGLACAFRWLPARPQRFDRRSAGRAIDGSHAGHHRQKARILDWLADSPQARDLVTVESFAAAPGLEADPRSALVVRRAPVREPDTVLCLAGPPGAGKTSLARAVAAALGRPCLSEPLGGGRLDAILRGARGVAPGRIVWPLADCGASNPVFILEGIDRVDPARAGGLLDVLDPVRRAAFRDDFLELPVDLSPVLWIATAVDPAAVPPVLRPLLEIVELPGYGEDEKVGIARDFILRRPFDGDPGLPEDFLDPGPVPAPAGAGPRRGRPPSWTVLADRPVSSPEELAAVLAEGPAAYPEPGRRPDAWRTAAAEGRVRFEDAAVRSVIRRHTFGPGVAGLVLQLERICRRVAHRAPESADSPPYVVTPEVVAEVLGGGPADGANGTGGTARMP